jgi:hypothetical protein
VRTLLAHIWFLPLILCCPATGKKVTAVAEGTEADVDTAVAAARKAFENVWGLRTNGAERGKLLYKLAEIWEEHGDRLAAIEALDNGKAWKFARAGDVGNSVATIRYYAGWADKNHGKVIEVRILTFLTVLVIHLLNSGSRGQARLHSPRTDRCCGPDHSLELSACASPPLQREIGVSRVSLLQS